MKLVSIIVPVYNVECYIRECIDSILSQKYSNIEILLIDDGSSDDSGRICDYYSENYSNIKVVHKHNGGLSSARNVGLDIATGNYISFIDSDDKIDNDYISCLVENIESSNSDIAVASIKIFYGNGITKDFYSSDKKYMSGKEYLINILRHKIDNSVCNKLFRTSIITDNRFKNGIINEDFPFMANLLRNVDRLSFVNHVSYYYRQRLGSITQQPNRRLYDFIQNAFESKSFLGKDYDCLVNEYIMYEAINFISTIEKFNAHKSFENEIIRAKTIITSNWFDFLKSQIAIQQKVKFILVTFFPKVYRSLLNLK